MQGVSAVQMQGVSAVQMQGVSAVQMQGVSAVLWPMSWERKPRFISMQA
jgi:hypothetical protein